jgi:putative hydrolase of HD superfamily
MQRLDQQMRFVVEIGKLKGVLRETFLAGEGLNRRENSAEHSWHLAMMVLVLAEHAPAGTDLTRVTAMVLIHDLVEIDASDLFLYADADAQAERTPPSAQRPTGSSPSSSRPSGGAATAMG